MQAPALLNQNLCWRYLSSQAVASQVLWTEMSLTTVFGMGTGGPYPNQHQLYVIERYSKTNNIILSFAPFVKTLFKVVTRTGFEPMLTA